MVKVMSAMDPRMRFVPRLRTTAMPIVMRKNHHHAGKQSHGYTHYAG